MFLVYVYIEYIFVFLNCYVILYLTKCNYYEYIDSIKTFMCINKDWNNTFCVISLTVENNICSWRIKTDGKLIFGEKEMM